MNTTKLSKVQFEILLELRKCQPRHMYSFTRRARLSVLALVRKGILRNVNGMIAER